MDYGQEPDSVRQRYDGTAPVSDEHTDLAADVVPQRFYPLHSSGSQPKLEGIELGTLTTAGPSTISRHISEASMQRQ